MSFDALEMRDKPAIVPLRFWTEYEPDHTDAAKLVPHEKVEWAKKGSSNGSTTVIKVRHLQLDTVLWPVLQPAYEAWKKNQEAPLDGTPLDAWPGVTPQQVKVMRDYHLRSVEDFATAPDSTLMKMNFPGIREMQGRAKAFLQAAQGQVQIAEALHSRDQTIANLGADLEEMRQLMKEMAAQSELPRLPKNNPIAAE
jgi:hypothetical protein